MQLNVLGYFRMCAIAVICAVCAILIFKDKVFRYLPSLAVIYNDDDLLTSRRIFNSGQVWRFRIGDNVAYDLISSDIQGSNCSYSYDEGRVTKSIAYFGSDKSVKFPVIIECKGLLVNKYFKIYVQKNIIVKIDLTVSMIGSV